MIFNSLGSNYNFKFAFNFLKASGRSADSLKLIDYLNQKYQGQTQLYYRGRGALKEAVRLTQSPSVIINSFSCFAVEQAAAAAGSQVIFADILPKKFHFDEKTLKLLHQKNPNLKAVVIQNTFGLGFKIKPILDYCLKHKIYLIEDLAHGIKGYYDDGYKFGEIGDLVILSFSRDKMIDVVNGGALIVRNPKLQSQVVKPRSIKGHFRKRLLDRVYPFFSCLIRFLYKKSNFLGQLIHLIFTKLNFITFANDGQAFFNVSLPHYRSRFVYRQLINLEQDLKRRQKLISIYQQIKGQDYLNFKHMNLVRYPFIFTSALVKKQCLKALKKNNFYFVDIWYNTSVYPSRMVKNSTYQSASCPVKEELIDRILNLPLHQNMSLKAALKLKEILDFYSSLQIKTQFSQASWQKLRLTLPQKSNLLISWPELQAWRALKRSVFTIGFYQNNQSIGLLAASLVQAKRGRFLKVVANPLLDINNQPLKLLMFNMLKEIALKHYCLCIRLQTYWPNEKKYEQFLKDLGYKKSPSNSHALCTLKIDLSTPVEKLFQGSKSWQKNTRNRINQARKKDLIVVEENNNKALNSFFELLKQTQSRQDFVANSTDFIAEQFQAYHLSRQAHLYTVLTKDDPQALAMALIIDDNQQAIYLYGASSALGQKMSAPYLLQHHIISQAQKRGLKTYDLWGVSPPNASSKHRFSGVTIFKKHFARDFYHYLPSHDLVLKFWRYQPLYWLERYETKKRHL